MNKPGTNDDLGTLAGLKRMIEEDERGDVDWNECKYPPPRAGTYLCYGPDVGPPPDFQWLRWDTDRGWRDEWDNKSFPTHWAAVRKPNGKAYECRACGKKWE